MGCFMSASSSSPHRQETWAEGQRSDELLRVKSGGRKALGEWGELLSGGVVRRVRL